jgi:hypothetical protein
VSTGTMRINENMLQRDIEIVETTVISREGMTNDRNYGMNLVRPTYASPRELVKL